jgi:hypothetical protein
MTRPPADVPLAGAGPPGAGLFEIVNGNATAEDVAALTVVLAAVAAGRRLAAAPHARPPAVSGWADRSRLMRSPLAHAPGGWRTSGRPQ